MQNGESLITKVSTFPRRSGIYLFKNIKGDVLYVGKALSIRDRVASYFAKDALSKQKRLISVSSQIDYIETSSEFEALILEAKLIKLHRPRYNIILKDDKSFLYIFISTGEVFPKIYTTRKPTLPEVRDIEEYAGMKGIYFGPFPGSFSVRHVLKLVRRIFPYCQQKRLARPCFYSHIGLCSPCPSFIVTQDPDSKKELTRQYRWQLFSIKHLFEGKLDFVTDELTRKMNSYAKKEQFENAAKIRSQLKHLDYVRKQPRINAYLADNEFLYKERKEAQLVLYQLLKSCITTLSPLQKIESYDISNLQSSHPVGAQVVFIDGLPEKSLYKRYRIKKTQAPNDSACLGEVLRRRLNHPEWNYPELILIDGGKTQLSAVSSVLVDMKIQIPVIALAKRLEQMVVPTFGSPAVLTLPRASLALRLVQAIRDETHRYVLAYHRLLRAKAVKNL